VARGAQARPLEARAEYAAGEVARQQGDTPKALGLYAAAEKILGTAVRVERPVGARAVRPAAASA